MWGNGGHVLNGARTGADRRYPLACMWRRMVPLGRMEGATAEPLRTFYVRYARHIQHPEPAHDDICAELLTGRRAQHPSLGRFFPVGSRNRRAESQVRADPVAVCAPFEVGEYLGLGSVRSRPPRMRLERVGVEMRRHVASGPRISVVVPRAADPSDFS